MVGVMLKIKHESLNTDFSMFCKTCTINANNKNITLNSAHLSYLSNDNDTSSFETNNVVIDNVPTNDINDNPQTTSLYVVIKSNRLTPMMGISCNKELFISISFKIFLLIVKSTILI